MSKLIKYEKVSPYFKIYFWTKFLRCDSTRVDREIKMHHFLVSSVKCIDFEAKNAVFGLK